MKRRTFNYNNYGFCGLSAFNFGCSNVTKNEGSGVVADIAVAFELEEETISSLREKLSSGKYTSEQFNCI
jgi:amidase